MATVVLRVCDICGNQEAEANEWELRGPRGRRVIDLCDDHAAPLAEVFDKGSTPAKKNATTTKRREGTPRTRMQVRSLEEIQAMKQG